ncbi:hypothetical protein EAW13_23225, partial [Salmonella enterica subsp. enterica serovar Anatum]|nr:hypothetical protein [Salmonella enterica subsp. enterica serovar Anatum]
TWRYFKYTRHTSSCMCCGCVPSPQSLTLVSSRRFARLPPSCNSNYLEYIGSARRVIRYSTHIA